MDLAVESHTSKLKLSRIQPQGLSKATALQEEDIANWRQQRFACIKVHACTLKILQTSA